MKILMLAPQPFLQERGSPIAVDRLLGLFSEHEIETRVITYHEGEAVRYPGITVDRIPAPPGVHQVPPGLSWKKIVCDLFLLVKTLRVACRREQGPRRALARTGCIVRLWLRAEQPVRQARQPRGSWQDEVQALCLCTTA